MPKGIYDRNAIRLPKPVKDCACGCGDKTKPGNAWIHGHNHPTKGKTFEELYGIEEATKRRAEISDNNRKKKGKLPPSKLRGRKNPGVSRAKKLWWASKTPEERTEISAAWQHAGFIASLKTKSTSIELKVEEEIKELGISYIPSYHLGRYVLDFYLTELKINVECDGDYWHSRPGAEEHDAKRDLFVRRQGIYVIRLSESAINSLGGSGLSVWIFNSGGWAA